MQQVVIENPILNSPFDEPCRHFRFSDDGITDEIVAARRTSQYFIPIPQPVKRIPTNCPSKPNGPPTASKRINSSTGCANA